MKYIWCILLIGCASNANSNCMVTQAGNEAIIDCHDGSTAVVSAKDGAPGQIGKTPSPVPGPAGSAGPSGSPGPTGPSGSSCSVTTSSKGATITCTDGTSATIDYPVCK